MCVDENGYPVASWFVAFIEIKNETDIFIISDRIHEGLFSLGVIEGVGW
jgi:hypothetical protein